MRRGHHRQYQQHVPVVRHERKQRRENVEPHHDERQAVDERSRIGQQSFRDAPEVKVKARHAARASSRASSHAPEPPLRLKLPQYLFDRYPAHASHASHARPEARSERIAPRAERVPAAAPRPPLRGVGAEHVVRRSLALIAEHVPRLVHLLESLLRARRGVLVGMKLQRELPVRLLQVRLGRGLVALEYVVVVLGAIDARDELALFRGGRVGPALGLGPRATRAGGRRAGAGRRPLPGARGSRAAGRARALYLLRQSHQIALRCARWVSGRKVRRFAAIASGGSEGREGGDRRGARD